CDPCGEECGGSAINGAVPAAGHFVQRAKRQPAFRQTLIDGLDAERQYRPLVSLSDLKASNALSKRLDSGNMDRRIHAILLPIPVRQPFIICSRGAHCQWVRARDSTCRSFRLMTSPRLSAEQHRALAMLATAGRDGVTQSLLKAH